MYNANVKRSFENPEDEQQKNIKERFNFFVSQALVVITIIDKDGVIRYQSPSVKQILGYDHRKRIGKNFLHSKLVHPDDVVVKENLLKKAFENPNKNFKNELRMLHKNGTWSWMEVVFNNQLKNSDIEGIVVITHDITERKLSELQKNEFLSIASHELKTPLTAIRAYSQLLIKKIENEKNMAEEQTFLENIVKQTDKIAGLINDLLDFSKIQEDKLSIQKKPFPLHHLIKKIIEDFSYMSSVYTISFHPKSRAFVDGDEMRIGQVITNLVTNAIKYSPASYTITINVVRKGNTVVTSVTDQGDGIPTSMQRYVFQRFFQIEENKAQQLSSGLGLYIAAEIIKLHNGKIWLKSKKGKGTTFYFSLPIAKKP